MSIGQSLVGNVSKLAGGPEDVLHDILKRGMRETCDALSAAGGFSSSNVRIPVPPEVVPVVSKLQMVPGVGQKADDFVEKMNIAAEQAVRESKAIFLKAVDKVKPTDVLNVLSSGERAGAELLRRLSEQDLNRAVEPIVKSVLKESEGLLDTMLDAYHKIPFVPTISFSLVAYVLMKTIDAIFKVLGDKEASSRASNPILGALAPEAPSAATPPNSQASLLAQPSSGGLCSFQVVVNGSMGKATKTLLVVSADSVAYLKCILPPP